MRRTRDADSDGVRRFALSATVAAALVAGPGAVLLSSETPALGDTPHANAQGVALAARVNNAYKRVPAAIITLHGASTGAFTEILKNGIVVAEQFEGANSSGTTMLVAPHGSPTYAKEPQTTCWRALAKSDGQTLDDVGHPLLSFLSSLKGVAVGAPRNTSYGWTLALSQGGVSLTLTISKALLVKEVTAIKRGQRVEEDIDNLTRTPSLFVPAPRC